MNEEAMKIAFDVLDVDGDGQVSQDELKECFSYSHLEKEDEN